MAAPRKYPQELTERATRLALDARREASTRRGAIAPRPSRTSGRDPTGEISRCGRDRGRGPSSGPQLLSWNPPWAADRAVTGSLFMAVDDGLALSKGSCGEGFHGI